MMNIRNRIIPVVFSLFPIFSAILLFSCSSRQVINVDARGEISCSVEIKLSKMFTDYINDLSEAAGSGKPDSYFDTQQIRQAFSSLDGVVLEKISASSKPELRLSFRIKDASGAVAGGAAGGVFSFTGEGENRKISFRLDRKNYRAIGAAFAFEDNPVLAGLTPQPDNPYSEEEYLELVDYVFAEYSPDAASVLSESRVEVEVNVKGKIISAEGGKVSGSKALFSVPVLRFLTLDKPVELDVVYRQ